MDFLDAGFSDLVARRDHQRVFDLLIILAARRADIAEQLSDGGPCRIIARKTLCRHDTRQVLRADRKRRIALPIEIFRHLDRLEPGSRLDLVGDALPFFRAEAEQHDERVEHGVLVLQAIRNDIGPKDRPVQRERLAVSVDDPPASRRDQRQVDPIAFGQQIVALVLGDRQPGHPTDEQPAQPHLRGTKHEFAARKTQLDLRFRQAALAEQAIEVHHAEDYRGLRRRSSAAHARATSG